VAVLADIEALSFDLFETLVDGELGRLPIVEWQGRRFPSTAGVLHDDVVARHPVSLDDLLDAMGRVDRALRRPRWAAGRELPNLERFEAIVAELGLDDAALARDLAARHMEMVCAHTSMPTHHPALLARLARRFRIALCSNFSHAPTARRILEERGLAASFAVVVVSDEVDARKPARPIFDAVARALAVPPERILHVGDRLEADVAGAAAAGMRTAWITRSVRDADAARAAWEGPEPDLVVADLGEIEAVLGRR